MNSLNDSFTIKKHRQTLHKIPEIGFDLPKTYNYIKSNLESYGYETYTYAETGIIAKKPGLHKESIAFRADMDALQLFEETQCDYTSTHPGSMHACGHDGHMAMVLGFAEYVSQIESLNESIVFLFQPAEEGPGGAVKMIEEGVLEDFHIKKIIGIHLYPNLEEGIFGITNGLMTAQDGDFDITIEGANAHGAEPHLGQDAILASAELIKNYQMITSKRVDPSIGSVLNVGTIHGGNQRNVISDHVSMSGTIRSFDVSTYHDLKYHMDQAHKAVEHLYGVKVHAYYNDLYPPVTNDKLLVNHTQKMLRDDEYRTLKPMMIADDFAYYQTHIPGMFVMLGTKNSALGYDYPLHSNRFNFDEKVLLKGVQFFDRLCKTLHVY